MTFLTALTGVALVLAVALASGALCYLLLASLNRLEVATVAPTRPTRRAGHGAGVSR